MEGKPKDEIDSEVPESIKRLENDVDHKLIKDYEGLVKLYEFGDIYPIGEIVVNVKALVKIWNESGEEGRDSLRCAFNPRDFKEMKNES